MDSSELGRLKSKEFTQLLREDSQRSLEVRALSLDAEDSLNGGTGARTRKRDLEEFERDRDGNSMAVGRNSLV